MTTLAILWDVENGIQLTDNITIRYYTLLFVVAFIVGLRLMKHMFRQESIDPKMVDSLLTYVFLGTILGARLGHVFFYDWAYYKTHLLEAILPVKFSPFQFVGYRGLASHGAAIGIIISAYYFSKKVSKRPTLWILDRIVIVVALAASLIRLGNLFNSEIIGSKTDMPWGFQFVKASHLVDPMIPRHPSQIYELLMFIIIFAILYSLYRKGGKYKQHGFLFGLFLILTFASRFGVEFFKEVQKNFENDMSLKMGQWLSIPLVAIGIYYVSQARKASATAMIAILSLATLASCSEPKAKTKTPKPTLAKEYFLKEGELTVFTQRGKSHDFDIEIADNMRQRTNGLMYRKVMKANHGMLFIMEREATQKFWMKNTYISLDIIYINTTGVIVDIIHSAKPFDLDLPMSKPALYAFEINGGLSKKMGIAVGDKIEWKRTQ